MASLIGVFHRYTYIFHGYSGISVVFRYFGDSCDPCELVTETTLFLIDSDDITWLRFDGSLFNSSDDLFLCLSYNVPEGCSRQGMLANINLFDRLSDQMVRLKTLTNDRCMFLVCADFNARTSDMPDYVQDGTATHIHVLLLIEL